MNHWFDAVSDNSQPLFFMLGLCAIESEAHTLKTAEYLKNLSEKLGFKLLFKAAFDKANRTMLGNYRGIGMEQGLAILAKVKQQLELPILTDVHESWQVPIVAEVADVIQTPAFLCRQTDLLVAAGKSGKPVHVKKGQFFRPEKMLGAVEKVQSTGNKKVWLCDRGTSFGYADLIVDMRSFMIMKSLGVPVTFDATHAVQKLGDSITSTGGDRRFVSALAAAAVSQGIAGLFMEVHEDPDKALSDGPNSVRLSQLEDLIRYLMDLDAWVKARAFPAIS